MPRVCGCGCGTEIAANRRYVQHHQNRRGAADYAVEDRGYDTPCWVWQRSLNRGKRHQYPGTTRNGKSVAAHRAYYEDAHGPIPEGMTLDHLCKQTTCVNPDHLEVVTRVENIRRGAKLTVEVVQAIHRRRAAGMTQAALAAMFDINPSQVSRILSGQRWSEYATGGQI